ncbi:MAG: hypothetical protein K2P93_00875 [Alphaproteobacteria bacterium]|nr:hypothetical protein [Alphaproteobacteria bacterium]
MRSPLNQRLLFIGGSVAVLTGLFIFLFFDAFYGGNKFRTMQDKIYSLESVDLRGLREIKASGGNLPRLHYVSWKLSHIQGPKTILDLKSEFHGYIKGIPTTFFGYNRSEPGLRHIPRRYLITGSIDVLPDRVLAEENEVKKFGFNYKSVNVGSKFIASDEQIDEIVTFFDSLPPNMWVHIHCTNGAGRTSTALAMLDIMKNAPQVRLEDINKRQYLLGSVDLFDTEVWKGGTYTKEELENRKKFIENFYAFICERKQGGIQLWSEWIRQKSAKIIACASQSKKQ